MTARFCRRSEKSFLLLFGMRQWRQLEEHRANITMVSRLSAKLSFRWEKSCRMAIFPNGLALWEIAAIEAEYFRQNKTFFMKIKLQLFENQ